MTKHATYPELNMNGKKSERVNEFHWNNVKS